MTERVHTEFCVLEEGSAPLLMSLPQMRHLGMTLDFENCQCVMRLGPQRRKVTTQLGISLSGHLVADFVDFRKEFRKIAGSTLGLRR